MAEKFPAPIPAASIAALQTAGSFANTAADVKQQAGAVSVVTSANLNENTNLALGK